MQVILNNVRINYDAFGRGPAVLFISDQQHDTQLWNPLAGPLIAAGFRVLLVDVDSRNYEAVVSKAIITLLNSLGIGRAALCGLEQGTLLNQLLLDYPKRVVCTFEAKKTTDSSGADVGMMELENIEETNQQLLDFLNSHAHRARSQATSLATAA